MGLIFVPMISPKEKFEKALKEKILLLDGAMGTMIQSYDLEEEDYRGDIWKDYDHPLKGNNDLLSVTRPDIIKEIHLKYLQAGSDIIETNTFSSTSIAQADYNLSNEAYRLNFESAKLAREAINEYLEGNPGEEKFVAGALGPTNKTASISPDVNDPGHREISFEELKEAYKEQVLGLIEGGADIVLIETIFDTLNAKAALFAAQEAFEETGNELGLMISGTITDASGRTLSGQTAEAFLISMSHAPLSTIGLNCGFGAKDLLPYIEIIKSKTDIGISAYPNAGLPNELGEYDQTDLEMQKELEPFIKKRLVNVLGGCCGTTPAHIKRMKELVLENS